MDEVRRGCKKVIGEGKEGSLADQRSSGFEEGKPIEEGKGSGKAVQGQGQGWSGGKARIASQALLPAKSPMRTLRAGENLWRGLAERFGQAGRISDDIQGFGADHAQKDPPDVSAGPIA